MVVANSKEHAAVTYAAADQEPLGAVNGVGQCEMIPVTYINVINPGNFIGCMAVSHSWDYKCLKF